MKLLPAFILFGALFVAMLSACAVHPTNVAQELFPLEVGRYWIYRMDGDEQKTVRNYIASEQTIGETRWFESVEYGENFWIRNGADGQIEAINLYTQKENAAIFEKIDPKVIHEELMYKYPASKGDNWITLENTLRYEGEVTLSVPAGTFVCHMYSITQYEQTYSHSCISKDIGIIYSDNILPNGKKEVSELVEWGKK